MTTPLKTLTIAGSDTSAAGGMQADLKTFEEFGTYGMVALTCIVTMDPENWNHHVNQVDPQLLKDQLATVFSGGNPDAMKTGMLGDQTTVEIAYHAIKDHQLKNVVIDPVMICKGETDVLNPDAANAIRDLLMPIADVTTPNLFEAGVLSGMGTLHNLDEMKQAAKKIHELGAKNVVVKGGKGLDSAEAVDVFYDGKAFETLSSTKQATDRNAGAGCTFAAAVVGGLANGLSVADAVHLAKKFDTAAIQNGFDLNKFLGTVFHPAYRMKTVGKLV